MKHDRSLHRHAEIRREWPPSLDLSARLSTHLAAILNLSMDVRLTSDEREVIQAASRNINDVLTSVAIRGV